jgi:phosphorylcholine metabolism protein LicD
MLNIHRLHTISQALSDEGISWWIDHGTLLGIVREDRLLPWDPDIDLSILMPDLSVASRVLAAQRVDLFARLVATDRNIKIIPHEREGKVIDIGAYEPVGDKLVKSLVMFPRTGTGQMIPLRQFAWRRLRSLENLCNWTDRQIALGRRSSATSEREVRLLSWTYRQTLLLRERVGTRRLSVVPEAYLASPTSIDWKGITLRAPSDPQKYLSFRYGSGWTRPNSSWKWWNDDQSI